VRIPLDYYRILGLPLAASQEQLRQAYSDRIVQLPRREYSQAAISSRKQLIEEAYVVLSDPKERSSYDQLYLAHAYDPDGTATATLAVEHPSGNNHGGTDTQNLSIEISQEELVGALLILQDLGEYEIVLKLGRPYLVHKNSAANATTHNNLGSEVAQEDRPDIVLTIALACLELGREQWQQGHYENAANSLETGLEVLSREGLFVSVQAEIQADLYKLRPYRILELLALPETNTAERGQGLELLQNILEDRGGIDGNGNDESGLNIDDFLRFIQQLRYHLTVTEQHKLFEAESKRPSAVATYLAVYALIARGFVQRQPALIRQAKQMLMRLGKRQDVHLEQSLCALLLGQTEEATRVLELSQEYEALAFIREKSQDSPDLLPGLCLYGEQWLQHEVFPHFRDLTKQPASLKSYFAEPQVQTYLEALPTDAEPTTEWSVINRQSLSPEQKNSSHNSNNSPGFSRQFRHSRTTDPDLPTTPSREKLESPNFSPSRWNKSSPSTAGRSKTPETPTTQYPSAERVAREPQHSTNGSARVSTSGQPQQRKKRQPSQTANRERRYPPRRRNFASFLQGKTRLVLTVLVSLVVIVVFWFIVSTTFGLVRNLLSPPPSLQGEQLSIAINNPPIEIPDKDSKPESPEGSLTTASAEEIIRNWLSTKAAALGPNYDVDSLQQILTGSSLDLWRSIAQGDKAANRYRQYEHNLKVESVEKTDATSNRASVEATVKEVTQFYQNGQIKKSSDETLRVRYNLVRQENVWRIQSMSVVNKISMIF
jgi:curved DNA-binding protein CbpA